MYRIDIQDLVEIVEEKADYFMSEEEAAEMLEKLDISVIELEASKGKCVDTCTQLALEEIWRQLVEDFDFLENI